MNTSDILNSQFDMNISRQSSNILKSVGYFFYVMNPKEHVYENVEDTRDYFKEITPLFSALLLAEFVVYALKKEVANVHELLIHVGYMVVLELSKIPLRAATLYLYIWVYTQFKVVTLPWSSPWTWILGLFVMDFWYYWMHRMSHQINFLWAIHETHHAPEHVTMPSSMSLHVFQSLAYSLMLMPTATLIPPTIYLVHVQMCFVCQIWVHTEHIRKLPALIEYIFNTPSHHRVHHGRNRKYVDKNFGAYFIIWDRMFGTYEDEDPDDVPIYGSSSVDNPLNILVTQTSYFRKIWKLFFKYEGIENKLSVIFKGPAWSPGKPWTGYKEDIPHPPPKMQTVKAEFSMWFEAYISLHGLLCGLTYLHLLFHISMLSKMSLLICSCFLIYSFIVFGFTFDLSKYSVPLEIVRCLMYYAVDNAFYPQGMACNVCSAMLLIINRIVINLSVFMWITITAYFAVLIKSDSIEGETKLWSAKTYTYINDLISKHRITDASEMSQKQK